MITALLQWAIGLTTIILFSMIFGATAWLLSNDHVAEEARDEALFLFLVAAFVFGITYGVWKLGGIIVSSW